MIVDSDADSKEFAPRVCLRVGWWMAPVPFSWGESLPRCKKLRQNPLRRSWSLPLDFSLFQSFPSAVLYAHLFLGWVLLPTHKLFVPPHICSSGLRSHLSYCLRRNTQSRFSSKWGVCGFGFFFPNIFFTSFQVMIVSIILCTVVEGFQPRCCSRTQQHIFVPLFFPLLVSCVWMHTDSAAWVNVSPSDRRKAPDCLWISYS